MTKISPKDLENLKFPIGQFNYPKHVLPNIITSWRNEIAAFPPTIKSLTADLNQEELEYTYRPNGWNIRQLVHHCADSHINAYIRFKLTLTEDTPIIKPYQEDLWAKLADYNEDIRVSLTLIQALHQKWVTVIDNMKNDELTKEFMHPETNLSSPLQFWIGKYAWHGNHHIAHIKQALQHKSRLW